MKKVLFSLVIVLMMCSGVYAEQISGGQVKSGAYVTPAELADYSTTTQMNEAIASATAECQAKTWYPLSMANGDYTGEVAVMTMAASCDVYNLLYITTSGANKATADTYAHLPVMGMCVETGTGARKVLLRGLIRNSGWSFTAGARLYCSPSTAGLITSTAPSTTGQQLQIVGIAISSDTIYFCPDSTIVEL